MNVRVTGRKSSTGILTTVVDGTREKIMAGDYRLGERLPTEPQLQEEWGVSRSVIREAMKILASQGLIRVEQGRGTFVNEINHNPLRQQLEIALLRKSPSRKKGDKTLDEWDSLLDLRLVLEMGAAERATLFATDAELETMRRSIESMRQHPGSAAACGEDDFNFHYTLAQATRNPLWPAMLGSLHDLLRRYLEISHHGPENGLSTAEEHDAIWHALSRRAPAEAAHAMRLHLESSGRDLAIARKKRRTTFRLQK